MPRCGLGVCARATIRPRWSWVPLPLFRVAGSRQARPRPRTDPQPPPLPWEREGSVLPLSRALVWSTPTASPSANHLPHGNAAVIPSTYAEVVRHLHLSISGCGDRTCIGGWGRGAAPPDPTLRADLSEPSCPIAQLTSDKSAQGGGYPACPSRPPRTARWGSRRHPQPTCQN
jgi:hypothetical protein